MALPSFLQRKSSPSAAPPADVTGDESVAVQQARTRARRRLIGALVLLAIGVVVFPMVFETQPRPLPRDIPIELPKREVAAAARSPATEASREPAASALPAVDPAAASAPESQARAQMSDVHTARASAPVIPTVDGGAAAEVQVAKATAKPGDRPAHEPAGKVSAAKTSGDRPESPAVVRKAESERVQALLDAQPAPASAAASVARGPRFVVQVGAYTDAAMLRDVRSKVEKLGLKTYTQSIDTEAGQRTRVRVGPFTTRAEAETASGKLKSAGLPGNVLVL